MRFSWHLSTSQPTLATMTSSCDSGLTQRVTGRRVSQSNCNRLPKAAAAVPTLASCGANLSDAERCCYTTVVFLGGLAGLAGGVNEGRSPNKLTVCPQVARIVNDNPRSVGGRGFIIFTLRGHRTEPPGTHSFGRTDGVFFEKLRRGSRAFVSESDRQEARNVAPTDIAPVP